MSDNDNSRGQRVYPVIDAERQLLGVMTRHDLLKIVHELHNGEALNVRLADMIAQAPVVAYPDEPLRMVVNRMAATGLTRFPVVQQNGGQELLGLIGLPTCLKHASFPCRKNSTANAYCGCVCLRHCAGGILGDQAGPWSRQKNLNQPPCKRRAQKKASCLAGELSALFWLVKLKAGKSQTAQPFPGI